MLLLAYLRKSSRTFLIGNYLLNYLLETRIERYKKTLAVIRPMKVIRLILVILVIFVLFFLIKWAIKPDISPDWTGFAAYDEEKLGARSKTLWDWLDLLIIPVVLAIIAFLYKEFEKIKSKRDIRIQRQHQAVDDFIQIITELSLDHNLATKKPKDGTKEIARSRVIFVLENIDGERKGQILQFLYESNLIDLTPKVVLVGANFKGIQLTGIDLHSSEIRGAYFQNSDLQKSNLDQALFVGCNFLKSNFSESKVENTDFSYSNLSSCEFQNMNLSTVNFEGANLTNADFSNSVITNKQLDFITTFQGANTKNSIII